MSDVYLFFGASGVGKGTQVSLLKEYIERNKKAEVKVLDMGAKLREVVSGGGFVGEKIDSIISAGNFLPSTLPVYFMYDFLINNYKPSEYLIADGVVRSKAQAIAFDEAMGFFNHSDYKILFIELSDKEIMQRLLARGRKDDTEEAIQKRIDLYKKQVEPLISLFEELGKDIIRIDGSPSVADVHQDILSKLNLK